MIQNLQQHNGMHLSCLKAKSKCCNYKIKFSLHVENVEKCHSITLQLFLFVNAAVTRGNVSQMSCCWYKSNLNIQNNVLLYKHTRFTNIKTQKQKQETKL